MDTKALHLQLVSLVGTHARVKRDLALLLAPFADEKRYRELGRASIWEYAEQDLQLN